LALVENLQRRDLNPMDEAAGYARLVDEFGFSQQQIAKAVGKDRSTIANSLRLLSLPEAVQQLVRAAQLSPGHARALLALPAQVSVVETARQIVARDMTVREVERLAQRGKEPRASRRAPRPGPAPHAAVRAIADTLRRFLQTDVQIIADEQSRGEVRIRFYSADDLERLLELITGTVEERPDRGHRTSYG
jgi:ParB family chromosome partitioning protein